MTQATYHVPVLTKSAVDTLVEGPEGPLVDGTLGGGGHTFALLQATQSKRQVIGIDRDPDAIALNTERFADEKCVRLVRGNFSAMEDAVRQVGIQDDHQIAGILLDLGVSSWQLDSEKRGFGFKHADAPLDMRMDPTSEEMSAAELIRSLTVPELSRILRANGDVRRARTVAQEMKTAMDTGTLNTTRDLANVVEAVLGRRRKGEVHPATTVFQALRIVVNGELEALDRALEAAPRLLKPGGRLVIISYHSLEDRRVKHTFREGELGKHQTRRLPPPLNWRPTWKVLTRKPVVADATELESNPRARSAKLRAAVRASLGGSP
jgi:16S rRNA (cytosine1402-N4)-methyltransferase